MKRFYRFFPVLIFFIYITAYAQEANDNEYLNDVNYDFGTAGEITVYGERPREFYSEAKNAYVINRLTGPMSERKRFIETDLLENAGFRRTGDVKYRRTDASEKALSVLHGVGHIFSFGVIPMKPFFETEYDKLPKGQFYKFESVYIRSNFKDVSPEVFTLIELEYILQIEFCNGVIINDNVNYYTDENIGKFERLIMGLPENPESVNKIKNRYLNELKRIKAALERYRNPSENYINALQNLKGSFNTK